MTKLAGNCVRILVGVAAAVLLAVPFAACHGARFGASGVVDEVSRAEVRPCDLASLSDLRLEAARIVSVTPVPAGDFLPEGLARPIPDLPAFCRVQAEVTPTSASRIRFELWIPAASAWNEKLVVTGNGGYSPAIGHGDMATALRAGYAALGGDTGHQTANPNDLSWGVGNPEAIADWGTRSIHAITGPGKTILAALMGQEPRRAYFVGCSTGGHQGYAEMQRYPHDFDGVIAGAPGNNRVRLNVGFLWQFLANREPGDLTPVLPAAKLPLITAAVVDACDANDGVIDRVVDDPRRCGFTPSALRCVGGDAPDCLTDRQLAALDRMYAGARNPRTGEQLYPGWPKSSEALTVSATGTPLVGWHQYWGTSEPARADFWRLWVFQDPGWDWWTFDFDRDVALADARVGPSIDQVRPDIATFRARGGKAIVYQGWQDPVVNALDTIEYYDSVRARQGSEAATDDFFRLFMVPGMGHCSGGTGATTFGNSGPPPVVDAEHDLLSALDRWVEQGTPPDRIIASRVENGATVRTRLLCPYPRRALYRGAGSTDDASNYVCR